MITLGTQVPQFELKDQNGTPFTPIALRGKHVLLSFHPLAWTGVCQRQMESLEMNASVFEELHTVAFGVSVDSVPCKKAWAESMNVKRTPLLADFWPHGGLASALGIFRDDTGISERANLILDSEGFVRWIKVYPISELPDLKEVIQVLKDLNS
ncbi:redoxin domain-containing protein [Candidatus Bipolaricaulota bacterium]|nr:redoxin domain-containing protein [Candidatus Bipolaricaulota bacterium]